MTNLGEKKEKDKCAKAILSIWLIMTSAHFWVSHSSHHSPLLTRRLSLLLRVKAGQRHRSGFLATETDSLPGEGHKLLKLREEKPVSTSDSCGGLMSLLFFYAEHMKSGILFVSLSVQVLLQRYCWSWMIKKKRIKTAQPDRRLLFLTPWSSI